ncbi:MAG: hypothetical protein ACK40O_06100 [Allosphingosinicella sp.]
MRKLLIAASALLACAGIVVSAGCAGDINAHLNRAEAVADVGRVLVDAAEANGLVDSETATRIRIIISDVKVGIDLARQALERGDREAAQRLADRALRDARLAQDEIRDAVGTQPPPGSPGAELQNHVDQLVQEGEQLSEQAAAR